MEHLHFEPHSAPAYTHGPTVMHRRETRAAFMAMTGLIAAGCPDSEPPHKRPAEASAKSAVGQDLVRDVWIDAPEGWWVREGFTELVPPIRLPTFETWNDQISVWMRLPPGTKIDWGERAPGLAKGLMYPPGTILDRVELAGMALEPGKEVMSVIDVRGTKLEPNGREIFHVYRPETPKIHSRLKGFEWLRGHARAQKEATSRLMAFLETVPTPYLSDPRDKFLAEMRMYNECAPCHVYGKPLSRSAGERLPRGATDRQGFYSVLRVLSDENAPEVNRPFGLNADDAFVTMKCGDQLAELERGENKRHYVCPDGSVPLGRRDISRGLRENDAYTLRVCDSRRYLFEHMTEAARAQFREAFDSCGITASPRGQK